MALLPGTSVGGYRITAILGVGGMGAVYLARHPRQEADVALKVLHESYALDMKVRRAFDREAELAARLTHPNIVAVQDRNAPGDTHLWLTMRPVRGGDLAGLLQASPGGLAPERAVALITDIARALDYAHSPGVLHRDVKPGNILVERGPQGEAGVLTDFGIARALDATLTVTAILATFAYAAPERFAGHHTADHRADVYSLGCTLFETLTGSRPFPGADPAAIIGAHLSSPPPSPRALRPSLPEDLDAVIATALAKRPGDRYGSCAELAEAAARAIRPRATVRAARTGEEVRLRLAVESGDGRAMLRLGTLLRRRGNYEEAYWWYRKAVDAGQTAALRHLGALAAARNEHDRAESWYRRAIEAGHHQAMRPLAGVREAVGDLTGAESWYRQAVTAGDLDACRALGLFLYRQGATAEAESMLRRAIDAGDNEAMNDLGCLLRDRGDVEAAERWFRAAVAAGDPYAKGNLGRLLHARGAVGEARRLMDEGEAGSLRGLADSLQPEDVPGEEVWDRRALDAADPLAMRNLAMLFESRGELDAARTWFGRGARSGDPVSAQHLARLLGDRELDDDVRR